MKFYLFVILAVATFSLSLFSSDVVRAQGGEIVLQDQSAESDFPNGVRFRVSASSASEINEVRVFFKKLGQTSRSSYRAVEFEPGIAIQGESLILSGTGGEYIPPGTRIEYSFEIRDVAGHELRTSDQVFVYQDNRFNWKTLSEGPITLYYKDDGFEGRAQEMLDAARLTLERMGPILGIEPKDPLHIVTYANYQDMRAALPFRSQAVSDGLVTQGTAFSEERVLLVLGDGGSYIDTTSHEFIHLLVADAAGRAIARVPAWLNEGLAEYGNIVGTDEYEGYLNQAIANNELRPLWHQTSFSGTPTDILVAYGQGESVVQFLQSTYGEEKMAELIRALKRTFDIDAALMETYGIDQYGLDSEWRKARGLEPWPQPEDRVTQQQTAVVPLETPEPTDAAVAPEATIEPTAASNEPGEASPAAPGCNAPLPGSEASSDLAMLMLLGGPLAMVGIRGIRRNRQ